MKLGSKEFIALQKQWYEKLAESGFEDLENFDSDGEPQKFLKHSFTQLPEKRRSRYSKIEQFFSKCRQYYNSAEFKTERDKTIWAFYSEGYSLRQIAKILEINRRHVTKCVKYHLSQMIRPF